MFRRFYSSSLPRAEQLTIDNINPHLKKAEYAVRGAIVLRAMEHEKRLKAGEKMPFKKVIYCNIGNPQSLEQKPITFHRQVLSLVDYPELLANKTALSAFPDDAVARAKAYLAGIPGGTGAYSESQGVAVVRQEVANFITERDGFAASPGDVFLTDGASPAVQMLIRSLIRHDKDTIMIPIPQYPLYSASITLYGGTQAGYYLDEDTNWGLNTDELRISLEKAKASGGNVRAIAVINPGNPTGGCLTRANMEGVVEFCLENNLVLLADEVYQENVYDPASKFQSFKKVASEMGVVKTSSKSTSYDPVRKLQLASFHSVSKGFLGECGRRGGYAEFVGFSQEVHAQLYKLASISLCSNLNGQIMTGLMVQPPKKGDISFAQYHTESSEIISSLARRAAKLSTAFQSMPGISCQTPQGAMYIFPRVRLPAAAVAEAKKQNLAPDLFYAIQLLDNTGVVVVPGSGFGQRDGTYHFRTTMLPPEREIDVVSSSFAAFHSGFMKKYGSSCEV